MGDNADVIHGTARPNAKTPGLLLAILAAVSSVVCVVGFAVRQVDIGVSAASVTLLAVGAVLSWLAAESRRARDMQRR